MSILHEVISTELKPLGCVLYVQFNFEPPCMCVTKVMWIYTAIWAENSKEIY